MELGGLLNVFFTTADLPNPQALDKLPRNLIRVIAAFLDNSSENTSTPSKGDVILMYSPSYPGRRRVVRTDSKKFGLQFSSALYFELGHDVFKDEDGEHEYALEDKLIAVRDGDGAILCDVTTLSKNPAVERCLRALLHCRGYVQTGYAGNILFFGMQDES